MKKFFKQAVTAVSAVSLLASSCITGMSAQITDSKDFAVQYASSGNSHTATVGVMNSSDSDRTFNLYTAVYNAQDSSLLDAVSVSSHSVAARETKFFQSDAITADSSGVIKVYAWENMKPLEYGTDLRTLSKNAYLSDLKIGDYDVNVDNESKVIYVNTDDDISSADITGITVSENASCTVAEDKSSITVTSEDGLTVNKFDIICASGVYIDFEDGTVGEEPAGWSVDERESCTEAVAYDPLDSTNKVFMLDDQQIDSSLKIGARYDFDTIEAPFAVTFKVMYDRAAEYSDKAASITGTWFHARNSGKNMISLGTQDFGNVQKYNVQYGNNEDGTAALTKTTSKEFKLRTWHEVKMVNLSEDEAKVYVDGELIFTGAPTNFLGVNRLHFFSSSSRTATTYLDDIMVRSISCGLKKISFTDGTDTVNGIIRDGRVYVNADDLSALTVAGCEVSDGCTYTYENEVITVTSSEGQSVSYEVYAINGVTLDFENGTIGSAPSGWNLSGLTDSTATVEADPHDSSNKVFKLDDNHLGSDKIGARYNFTAVEAPFSVSYKVMYTRADEYSDTGASINGTWMHARNSGTNILSVGTWENGTSQKLNVQDKSGSIRPDNLINLGKWHEIEMVCLGEDEAYVYLDGELIHTGAPANYLDVSRLNYFSSTTRTSTAYFDDIVVRPYYLEPCMLESVSFTDGTNNAEAYIHENTVFVNAESIDGLTVSECVISENCTYSYENGVISVSSAEGQTVSYTVTAQQYFSDDYESYSEGDFVDSANYDVTLESAKAEGSVSAAVVKDDGNQILVLTDNDGNGSAGARTMINIISTPASGASKFVVDFDVKYDYISDDTVYSASDNPGYFITEIRDSSSAKLAGVQPTTVYSSDTTKQIFNYAAMSETNTYSSVSTVKAGEWYNVKIVYTPNSDSTAATADYYVDGKLVATKSVTNVSAFGRVFLSTSTTRRAVLSYDNFKIISLD